ncbi:MAG: CRISPR system precrRNA processing endoribonuclease RAMP protein Cas6 [Treponema sp.]|jgi:hypothetical protein|nr:CRISPR system precrRNA processing endoribonuclease RAMP protein Cas6 [Treponema sp.]
MKLIYKKIRFTLILGAQTDIPMPIPFLFRSIIGKQLRRLCCIAHDATCPACIFNATCLYGTVFESVIPKDNTTLAGHDRISHPVIIETEPFIKKNPDPIALNLILLGDTIQHIPYFFQAIKQGGEAGILKARIPYTIQEVFDGERLMNGDSEILDTRLSPDVWEYHAGDAETVVRKTLLITLNSPLRFRVNGHYTDCFSAADFAHCLYRRTQTLCAQYGDASDAGDYRYTGAWDITEKNLLWRDLMHYSARQNYTMKLGGVSGSFSLSGAFTGYELALLRFAELFHAGKNTNFGLGKIGVWEKSGGK